MSARAPIRQVVEIINQRGLHARASAKFVKLAETFDARIEVHKDGMAVPGTSIMGLLMLAAGPGTEIEIHADGPDSDAALEALVKLIGDRFGED